MINRLKAYLSDWYQNLMNIPDKIDDVSGGFAIGIFFSLSPWVGLHIVLIFIFTRLLRKSFGAGVLSSLVFNPLTAPFIWAVNYEIGRMILGRKTPWPALQARGLFNSWDAFTDFLVRFVPPLTVGGLIVGVPAAIISYYLVRDALLVYRAKVYGKVLPKIRRKKKS